MMGDHDDDDSDSNSNSSLHRPWTDADQLADLNRPSNARSTFTYSSAEFRARFLKTIDPVIADRMAKAGKSWVKVARKLAPKRDPWYVRALRWATRILGKTL